MSLLSETLYRDALKARAVVAGHMIGRMSDGRESAAVAAAASVMAGDGTHIETGVLWGGSLLTTALLRKWYGVKGKVIGVDPLNGYYKSGPDRHHWTNQQLRFPISAETLWANAQRLDLSDLIELVPEFSYPWPKRLLRRKVNSAHIDGDHWGTGPYYDFQSVASRGARVITFDNFPDGSQDGILDVGKCVERVLREGGWGLTETRVGVAILVRQEEGQDDER